MRFRQYLLILYIASRIYAQDSTLTVNEREKKEIIYLKDGTYLECAKVHKGAYMGANLLITLYIGCGDKTVEYEKTEKIIYPDGSAKFEGELMRTSKKIKFWYYTALSSIIVGLTLLA